MMVVCTGQEAHQSALVGMVWWIYLPFEKGAFAPFYISFFFKVLKLNPRLDPPQVPAEPKKRKT